MLEAGIEEEYVLSTWETSFQEFRDMGVSSDLSQFLYVYNKCNHTQDSLEICTNRNGVGRSCFAQVTEQRVLDLCPMQTAWNVRENISISDCIKHGDDVLYDLKLERSLPTYIDGMNILAEVRYLLHQ